MEDTDEKKRKYRREYYKKNKEKEILKAKERYAKKKEKECKESSLRGRPRRNYDNDDTRKDVAKDARIRGYIRKIKDGEDIDIGKMASPQLEDLVAACFRIEREHNELIKIFETVLKIEEDISNSGLIIKSTDPKSEDLECVYESV